MFRAGRFLRDGVCSLLRMLVFPALISISAGYAQVLSTNPAQESPTLSSAPVTTTAIDSLLKRAYRTSGWDLDSGLALYRTALRQSREAGYRTGIVKSLLRLSDFSIQQGNYDGSIRYALAAQDALGKTADTGNEPASVCNLLAKNYFLKGNYSLSAFYGYKGYERLRQTGFRYPGLLSDLYMNLFMCASRLGADNAAAFYIDQAEKTIQSWGDSSYLAMLYTNKAALLPQEKWQAAKIYYLRALDISSRHHDQLNLESVTCLNLARVYYNQKLSDSVISYARRALQANRLAGSLRNDIEAYYMLGLGYFLRGQYATANKYATRALSLAEPLGYFDNLPNVYEAVVRIAVGEKKYKKALYYYQHKHKIDDSLKNMRKFKSLNELEARYRVAEKDNNIAQHKLMIMSQENALRKKNMWIGGISAGIIFLTIITTAYYRINRHRQRLQQEQITRLQQEQHIARLEAAIQGEERERARMARELHDGIVGQLAAVRWNLNAIQTEYDTMGRLPRFREAITQLDEAASDLRNTAHNLLPGIITGQTLDEAVGSFCAKTSKSSGVHIDFYNSAELPDLDPDFKLSVYRMIQELVQNIIKHAQASQALVQIDYSDPMMAVTVEDNGTGFDRNNVTGKGIGLNNIPERIKALQGKYYLESDHDGTSIHLEFDTTLFKNDKLCL